MEKSLTEFLPKFTRRLIGKAWMAWILKVVPVLAIAIAVFAANSNALNGPFLFDDDWSIVNNPSIRSLTPLSKSLWGPRDTPTAGRPVVNLSFAFNYSFGRLDVVCYHLANVLLHVINATLLFALIRRTIANSHWSQHWRGMASTMAFTISLLWALHPLQTEVVTYVTQRTELLMAFFLLATLYSARLAWEAKTLFASVSWNLICVASCALGMASKEVMVVAPILVVLYDMAVFNRSLSTLMKRRLPLYLCLAATWGILAALLLSSPRSLSVGFGLTIQPHEYFTTQMWAITRYLWLAFWPADLCGDYGSFKITDLRSWLPSFFLISFLVGICIWSWFRWPILSFLGGCFFLILAPTSSIVPIVSEPIAERRMYLPLASILCLFTIGLVAIARRWIAADSKQPNCTFKASSFLIVFALIIGFIYACTTYSRNRVFQSEIAFWKDVTQKHPHNPRAFNNLGSAYYKKQQPELAMASFRRSIEIEPSTAEAQMNIGNLFLVQNDFVNSRHHLDLALQLNPRHAHAITKLGIWHSVQGDTERALEYFNQAIAIDPSLAEAIQLRGDILFNQGRLEEAIHDFKAIAEANPDSSPAFDKLGNAYLAKNEFDQAAENFLIAIRIDPKSSSAYSNLGTVWARKGEFQAAAVWFENAVKLDPLLSDALYNLGNCYALLERTQDAIATYLKYLSLQPNDVSAWFALGKAYLRQGQISKARESFERVLQLKPDAIEAQQELQHLGAK